MKTVYNIAIIPGKAAIFKDWIEAANKGSGVLPTAVVKLEAVASSCSEAASAELMSEAVSARPADKQVAGVLVTAAEESDKEAKDARLPTMHTSIHVFRMWGSKISQE